MPWQAVTRRQHGVVSREQLLRAGLSSSAIGRMVSIGELVATTPGVYRVGAAPLTYRAAMWAAVIATGGVLSHTSAGELWGMLDRRDAAIHVLVPHRRRVIAPPRVRLHRWRPEPIPVTRLSDLPLTGRLWTILSVLARCPARQAIAAADRAIQQGWLRTDDIEHWLRKYPKRHGNTQLRRILGTVGDGAAAQSERRLHGLLRSAGICDFRPNYPVWVEGELIAVIDVALPHHCVAIEVDGMAHHIDVDRFQRDRSRQNALVALGWTVLRFTWADLTDRPGAVIAAVRRAMNRRGEVPSR